MPTGAPVVLVSSDSQRILLQLRLLVGSAQVLIGWQHGLPGGCCWPMGAPGPCCDADQSSPMEREYWYSRHGGLCQEQLSGWLVSAGGMATMQVHEVMYGSYLRDKCEDERRAEAFAVPAGAAPHYWYRCSTVVIR